MKAIDVRAQIERDAQEKLQKFVSANDWRPDLFSTPPRAQSEHELISQFFFCLLGGFSVTYELNVLAHSKLSQTPGFNRDSLLDEGFPARAADILRMLPVSTSDGEKHVSYRFPNSKAHTLSKAALWLEAKSLWELGILYDRSPVEARELLVECPGVGYKTASWFLRNIGHGQGLAIIDVHVERIAIEWALIPYGLNVSRDYLEIESRLQFHCNAIGCDLSEVDLGIWKYSRGDLVDHGTGQRKLF